MQVKPVVVGWTTVDGDNGFVAPDNYTNPNIICHKQATPGQTSATVKAGGTVELQWTAWPSSHHGPVIGTCNCLQYGLSNRVRLPRKLQWRLLHG
jgi:cellulase